MQVYITNAILQQWENFIAFFPSNMIPNVLKWIGLGIITSYIMGSFRTPVTLGSLSKDTFDLYPPDFYPNGTDLELPLGTMRYWKFGNEGGNRVVLVHGITTGSSCYDRLARDLVKKKDIQKISRLTKEKDITGK